MITAPSALLRATYDQFRRCGARKKECVAYWIGPADQPTLVDEVRHPVHVASPQNYEVDSMWLHQLWVHLGKVQRSVRMQIHTHVGKAWHSPSDDMWPIIHTPGFLSLVVPHCAQDPIGEGLYLAEIDSTGHWLEVPTASRLRFTP
jgi:hypothetical protein